MPMNKCSKVLLAYNDHNEHPSFFLMFTRIHIPVSVRADSNWILEPVSKFHLYGTTKRRNTSEDKQIGLVGCIDVTLFKR